MTATWPASHRVATREPLAQLAARVREPVEHWAAGEGLPPAFCAALEPLLLPLAAWLSARAATERAPLVIGISGAQGTGKSALSALLALLFEHGFGLRCATLSIDDLYLTREEREQLARDVHPLLRTRGVPGTHDVTLGLRVLDALRGARAGDRVRLPRFDKARDDRLPEARWPEVGGPLDAVLFEGWCVGARPEPDEALRRPVNALERERDPDGRWRRYANAQLGGAYRALFAPIDVLIFLAAPDLRASLAWRTEQECKLRARAGAGSAAMSDAEVARFVQHYERIAEHMLRELPGRADVVLSLARDHGYAAVAVR